MKKCSRSTKFEAEYDVPMKAKIKHIAIILLLAASCKSETPYDEVIWKLYAVLENKATYEAHFQQRIDVLKDMRKAAMQSPAMLYDINARLADEYASYSLDSAVLYLSRNRSIADELGDRYKATESEISLATLYAKTGYHIESSDILHRLPYDKIPFTLRANYFRALHSLSGELMAYSQNGEVWQEKKHDRDMYRDSLLRYVPEESFEWYELKSEEADNNSDKALRISYIEKMLECCESGSHDYAKACFLMQYSSEDHHEQMTWFARSAIADCLCAVKDYASLQSLSRLLFEEGDIDRAFRYTADHSMPDAISFNGKLRPWQIAQFFPDIERAFADKTLKQKRGLTNMVILISFLLLVLCAVLVLFFMRQNVLDKTRRKLEESYLEIESHNRELEEERLKLQALNSRMKESDKVKQEYITSFLSILSDNISADRQYKNHVRKHIRRGDTDSLIAEIDALPPIDEDISKFYKMFDETFINIYPDFVEKFNQLLKEGETITPKDGDILTPELRIFALVKLGISDYGKIASLLHYSTNTIYNYRAKIKNKSDIGRDDFEAAVRAIA